MQGNSHGGGSTPIVIVVHALGLVKGGLGGRLLVIGLDATNDAVSGVGDGLLDFLLSGLGGVRSELLLALCRQ